MPTGNSFEAERAGYKTLAACITGLLCTSGLALVLASTAAAQTVEISSDTTISTTVTETHQISGASSGGAELTIEQTGEINVSGDSNAIWIPNMNSSATSNGNTIENFGNVESAGGAAILIQTRSNTINNQAGATISSFGNAGIAIREGQDGTFTQTINNMGTIKGKNSAIELAAEGKISIKTIDITNSGTLETTDADSFIIRDELDANVNLTLNAGTRLIQGGSEDGPVRFDLGGGTNTVYINSLSADLLFLTGERTIDGEAAEHDSTVPEFVAGNGIVLFTSDVANANFITVSDEEIPVTVVTVVDQSAVPALDARLADLTRGISSAVSTRLTGLRSDVERPTANGFLAAGDSSGTLDHRFWTQVFGSVRETEAEGSLPGSREQLGGFVVGADEQVFDDLLGNARLGLFAGFATGREVLSFDLQESRSQSFFTGAYASVTQNDLTYDLSLVGGYSNLEQEREVLTGSGNETVSADYSAWFVSPELRVTGAVPIKDQTLEGSISLHYAGLFIDDYTETGAASLLDVESRSVHVGVARAELALPGVHVFENGSSLRYRLHGGLEIQSAIGDNAVSGRLLAGTNGASVAAFSYTPENPDDGEISAFLGHAAEFDLDDRIVINTGLETHLGGSGNYQVTGNVGLKLRF